MLGIVFVIMAGLLWTVDTVIRYPLVSSGILPEKIVFAEHLFLCLIFLPFFIRDFAKFKKMKMDSYFYFFIIGVLGSAIATFTFTKAFSLINPSLVILLQKLQPVIAISLARVFLGEKIKKPFIFWAAIALVGGFLISSPDIMPGLSNLDFRRGLLTENAVLGYLFTLIAVVSWGASTVFGKKLSYQGFTETQIMSGRFITGFVFMGIYLFAEFGTISMNWSVDIYLKVFALVMLSGLLGMYVFYKGLKTISARACAIAEMFFPFSAVCVNWFFFDAKLLPVQILGAVILAISSTVIQYKKY